MNDAPITSSAARRVGGADDLPGAEGAGQAPQLELTARLDLQPAAGQVERHGADQDLPRRRRLLETGGDVDGLTGRERRFAVVDHHLTGLDPDPDGEAELFDGGEDGDRGARGPLGVVLVCLRHPECRHHRVPGELLDDAPVSGHALRHAVEEFA